MKIYEINRAPINSPAFTGVPTAPTGGSGNQIATNTDIANAIAGVNPAIAVSAATTAAGNTSAWTYNNGIGGIGATFTGPVNTAITIDGFTYTTITVQSLLVKNDTQSPSGVFNGIFVLTALQTIGTGAIFTRRLDYDTPSDINNTGAIPVVNGTTNGTTSWLLTSAVTTVGTDPLIYTPFVLAPSTIATFLATAPLTITSGGTTTINAQGKIISNFYASSNATATTIAFSGIPDGATVTLDYLKTTASSLVITFPVSTVISQSSNCNIVTNVATLSSTSSGRYTITITNINSVYKVYIINDIA